MKNSDLAMTQNLYFELKKTQIMKQGRESSGNLGAFMSRNLRNHGTLSPLMIDRNHSAANGGIGSGFAKITIEKAGSTFNVPSLDMIEGNELFVGKPSPQKLYKSIPINKYKTNGVKVVDRYNQRQKQLFDYMNKRGDGSLKKPPPVTTLALLNQRSKEIL